MNFLKNVISITQLQKSCATLRENGDTFINNAIEDSISAVEQNANSIEEVMTSQSYNGSENNDTVDDDSNKKCNVPHIENIIYISRDEETSLNLDDIVDFHNNNNELVQNNEHDSRTNSTLSKKDESTMIEINDFEQILQEFCIKNDDKFRKCCNMVDSFDRTVSNVNEELNLKDIDELFGISNIAEENGITNDNKKSEELNNLDMNQMQLLKLKQFRKPKEDSDNKTPTIFFNTIESTHNGQTRTAHKQVHEIQFNKSNNFEVQSDEIETSTDEKKSCVSTSVIVDLTVEEHDRVEGDETKFQNCIQDNKIEKMKVIPIQDQNTAKQTNESDDIKIISINNNNIAESKDGNKIILEKDNITIDFVNKRDDHITATPDIEPTDIETISLLSIEANIDDVDLDFCNGYHSSDFEFITESDAEIEGLITNTSKTVEIKKSKTKRVAISKNASSDKDKPVSVKVLNNSKNPNSNINEDLHQPGPSNVKTNTSFGNFNKTYNAVSCVQNHAHIVENSRPNHAIPQDQEYLNLFRGIHAPMFTDMFFLENKSVRAQTCMNIEYEGVGFDIRMPCREDSAEENKEEANETMKKILELYPIENRCKRKRRRL